MKISARLRKIIIALLEENNPISLKYLAEKIDVSKRTIQRELDMLPKILDAHRLTFMTKTGVGIWIEGEVSCKRELLRELKNDTSIDLTDKDARRKRLILEILKEKGLKKLFYYSSMFEVSETTIATDLETIEDWFQKYDLKIVRKPGSGVEIEGSENSYRKAIRAFIHENIDTEIIKKAYNEDYEMHRYSKSTRFSKMLPILNENLLKGVVNCISSMDSSRVLTLTENSYMGLILHITIAMDRIIKGEVMENNLDRAGINKEDEDYQLAHRIAQELEKELKVEIPEVEIAYICLHIKGSKHEKIQLGDRSLLDNNREIQQLINKMIDAFDDKQTFFLKRDDEFIQGLLAHLQPTLIRLKYGMEIHNPIIGEIKRDYRDIYEKCKGAGRVLSDYIGKEISEEEIGFLTVHFGAALVRAESYSKTLRKVRVGLICSSGIGISRLMASKLKNAFRGKIEIRAYGKDDITPYIIGKTDFFVSSTHVEIDKSPLIFVNPLLSQTDMEKIGELLHHYGRMPEKSTDTFTADLEEIHLMATQIRTLIKNMGFFLVKDSIRFEALLDEIGRRLSPYSDRQMTIQKDLMKRERISTQVFAEFDFALLHTRTSGVVRPEFSICMTEGLSEFKDPYLKGIHIVFIMLVPIDHNLKLNSEIMGYISSLLVEETDFLDLVITGEKEAIRAALSKYLKRFFNKYLSSIS